MGQQLYPTNMPGPSMTAMTSAPQEQELLVYPEYLEALYRHQRSFLTFRDEEEAKQYGFIKWENISHCLEMSCRQGPYQGGGCLSIKTCTYCKIRADDRTYNPLMIPNLGDIENTRRALLELGEKQKDEPWVHSDRKATLQQMLHLIGNQGLLPTTRPYLKNHGYLHCPESMWALVKQTPNHYIFRTALVQVGGIVRLRYQVLYDPGNGRYKYMAEEVWKLDLRVWMGGGGTIPNEKSVGDVIEVASSVACLAPYFVSATSTITQDSLMEQLLQWSDDVTQNIL